VSGLTSKPVYPSDEKRKERMVMRPKLEHYPGHDDTALAFALKEYLHQGGYDYQRGVNKRTIVDAIVEMRDVGRRPAYDLLKRLWRCGLVTRLGNYDPRSGRPRYQLWIVK
jgi:hypothetical protein